MIREARRADLEPLLEAVLRLNATGHAADPRYELRPDARGILRERIAHAWFGRFNPFPACWIDERDGAIAAYVAGEVRADHPILWHPPLATVTDLWVEPAWRRRGLARALVDRFRAAATAAGCARIEVSTLARDERAVAFWRAAGFDDLRVVLAWDAPRSA